MDSRMLNKSLWGMVFLKMECGGWDSAWSVHSRSYIVPAWLYLFITRRYGVYGVYFYKVIARHMIVLQTQNCPCASHRYFSHNECQNVMLEPEKGLVTGEERPPFGGLGCWTEYEMTYNLGWIIFCLVWLFVLQRLVCARCHLSQHREEMSTFSTTCLS